MEEQHDPTTFGGRLAIALGNTTREDLAEALGISVSAIGQALNGKTRAFTAENTAMAARFLGVDWFWLATGRGSPRAVHADGTEEPVLSALREIKRLAPQTHEQLLSRVSEIANGLRASDNLIGTSPVVKRAAR
jgi:transcriptional regulator with XRE-family HTH domain